MFRDFIQLRQSASATKAPVIDAVRGRPNPLDADRSPVEAHSHRKQIGLENHPDPNRLDSPQYWKIAPLAPAAFRAEVNDSHRFQLLTGTACR